jgi:hypothetical protein
MMLLINGLGEMTGNSLDICSIRSAFAAIMPLASQYSSNWKDINGVLIAFQHWLGGAWGNGVRAWAHE